MQSRNRLTSLTLYLLLIVTGLALTATQMRAQEGDATPRPPLRSGTINSPATPIPAGSPKLPQPRFMLSTNRAYGSDEVARVWLRYQDITALNFRVYQVKDPTEFFRRLPDLHQLGGEDFAELERSVKQAEQGFSLLTLLHDFRAVVYKRVRRYVRGQLRRQARASFNDKYRVGDQSPIDQADYARLPSLESEDLLLRGAWRQTLMPQSGFDSRTIPFGKREPGVYLIEATHLADKSELRAYAIAVVTDLTMVVKTAPSEMLVYLAYRKSGAPFADASVTLVKGQERIGGGSTNRDGILKIQLPSEESAVAGNIVVMAERQEHFAISDFGLVRFLCGTADTGDEASNLKGFIYTDRPIYRPKDKVYFKGIVRKPGKYTYELPSERAVALTVTVGNGRVLFVQQLTLTANGTFHGELNLPSRPLGKYTLSAQIGKGRIWGDFEVDEYRKPEFKLRVTTPKPFMLGGEKTTFKLEAQFFKGMTRDPRAPGAETAANAKAFYLYGAPVANAQVSYEIYRAPYQHNLEENLDDAVLLGDRRDDDEFEDGDDEAYRDMVMQAGKTRLDVNGRVEIPFEAPRDTGDFRYHLVAQVLTRGTGDRLAARASVVVTRSRIAVTATPGKKIVYQGEPASIRVKTADYAGQPVSAKVRLKFVGRQWIRSETSSADKPRHFEVEQIEKDLGTGEVTTDAQGDAVFTWRAPVTGVIKILALLNVEGVEISLPGGELWVADRAQQWADFAAPAVGTIRLVPDKTTYAPGETAHVQALLPTSQAHLLVTIELRSILKVWRVDAPQGMAQIDVPIESQYAPNVYLSVCYVKDGEIYTADKTLAVPARDKFLKVEIKPNNLLYKPRDPATYDIVVKNADGTPAAGVEVSLGIVDEAVYSVSPETLGNLRRAFYGYQFKCVDTHYSTHFSFTGYSDKKLFELARNKSIKQFAQIKNDHALAEAKIRKDFRDTAFWQPNLITDREGKQTVKLILPDNQTVWRATARAVSADLRLGTKVTRVVSRSHLMINLDAPPFVTEGDTVIVAGTVHNFFNQNTRAQVELQASGVTLLDPARRWLELPKQSTQQITWRVTATRGATATLRAKISTPDAADGIQLLLPIAPSGVWQNVSKAITLTENSGEAALTLNLPAHARNASLLIDFVPSLTGVMQLALESLPGPWRAESKRLQFASPPKVYPTTEQAMSTALIETAAGQTGGRRGVVPHALVKQQHADGGWGWAKEDKTDPFMTAYILSGLANASDADSNLLARGRKRLGEFLETGRNEGVPIDPELRAYLLYAYVASGNSNRSRGLPSSIQHAQYPRQPVPSAAPLTRPAERPAALPYPVPPKIADPPADVPARPSLSARPPVSRASLADQLAVIRGEYAASLAVVLRLDGSYQEMGVRKMTALERNMLELFGRLMSEVREFERGGGDPRRLRGELEETVAVLPALKLRAELDRRIRSTLELILSRVNAAPFQAPLPSTRPREVTVAPTRVPEPRSVLVPTPENLIAAMLEKYAAALQTARAADGSYEFPAERQPTPDQLQLLYSLGELSETFNAMRQNETRNAALRLRDKAQVVRNLWERVSKVPTAPREILELKPSMEEFQKVMQERVEEFLLPPAPRLSARPSASPPAVAEPYQASQPSSAAHESQRLDVVNLLAERTADGKLRVSITGQAPTSGWRLAPETSVENGALQIILKGYPPAGMAAPVISFPTTVITLDDSQQRIQRVIAHGLMTSRSTVPLRRSGANSNNDTGSESRGAPPNYETAAAAGVRISDKLEALVEDYAHHLRAWRGNDNTYSFEDASTSGTPEAQLLYAFDRQAESARVWRGTLTNDVARRAARELSSGAQQVNRLLPYARVPAEFTQRWQGLEREINQLTRLSLAAADTLTAPPTRDTRPADRISRPPMAEVPPARQALPLSVLPPATVIDRPSEFHLSLAKQAEQLRAKLGAGLGAQFNPLDGSYEFAGARQPSAAERQALDRLAALAKDLRRMSESATKDTALRCSEELRALEQVWTQLKVSAQLTEAFKNMRTAVRAANGSLLQPNPQAMARPPQLNPGRQQRYLDVLFANRNELKPYGKALLALSLEAAGDRARASQVSGELERLARVTATEAHWESTRPAPEAAENCHLEATAFAIRVLARLNPQSPLLPKAVRWLLAARYNGYYWETPLHTALALMALADCLEVIKEPQAASTVMVYLNGALVDTRLITGLDVARGTAFFNTLKLGAVRSTNQIRLVKRGGGSLYVSASLDYLASDTQAAARPVPGLQLTREYLRLRLFETQGKSQWTVEPLSGDPQPGDLLVSRLKVRGARQRYLMLEDPLPAGCVPAELPRGINLNKAAQNWRDPDATLDNYSRATDTELDLQAPRKLVFQQFFPGEAVFLHALRVQLPGEFKVAPARATLVYQPAIQATTESRKLRIADVK